MKKKCLAEQASSGSLYIAALPIGNKKDVSLRVLEIAREVSYILAEDTRTSAHFFSLFQIKQKFVSYHDFSNDQKRLSIIEDLKLGKNLMLVSEAGTPTISDPGFKLVEILKKENIKVVPLPGASAVIAALSASGLPTDKFLFAGFLNRGSKRYSELEKLLILPYTVVLYESPQRVVDTLEDIYRIAGNREIFFAREMTKMYEEYLAISVKDLISELKLRDSIKGEIVLIVKAVQQESEEDLKLVENLLEEFNSRGLSARDSVEIISKVFKMKKSKVKKLGAWFSD